MDHSHISGKWDEIRWLCNMLHDVLLKIHEYKILMTCTILKLCNQYTRKYTSWILGKYITKTLKKLLGDGEGETSQNE